MTTRTRDIGGAWWIRGFFVFSHTNEEHFGRGPKILKITGLILQTREDTWFGQLINLSPGALRQVGLLRVFLEPGDDGAGLPIAWNINSLQYIIYTYII